MEDLGLVKTLRGRHFSQHETDCGAERLWRRAPFLNAFGARRPLTKCLRMLALRVSSCVEARTPASRERYGHLVLQSSVSAWPSQQGASAGFHTSLRISRVNFFEARFLQLLRPIKTIPKNRTPKCVCACLRLCVRATVCVSMSVRLLRLLRACVRVCASVACVCASRHRNGKVVREREGRGRGSKRERERERFWYCCGLSLISFQTLSLVVSQFGCCLNNNGRTLLWKRRDIRAWYYQRRSWRSHSRNGGGTRETTGDGNARYAAGKNGEVGPV